MQNSCIGILFHVKISPIKYFLLEDKCTYKSKKTGIKPNSILAATLLDAKTWCDDCVYSESTMLITAGKWWDQIKVKLWYYLHYRKQKATFFVSEQIINENSALNEESFEAKCPMIVLRWLFGICSLYKFCGIHTFLLPLSVYVTKGKFLKKGSWLV